MRRIASSFRILPSLWISRSGSAVTIDLPSPSCHRRISWRRKGSAGDAVNIADWLRGLGLAKYAPIRDDCCRRLPLSVRVHCRLRWRRYSRPLPPRLSGANSFSLQVTA